MPTFSMDLKLSINLVNVLSKLIAAENTEGGEVRTSIRVSGVITRSEGGIPIYYDMD